MTYLLGKNPNVKIYVDTQETCYGAVPEPDPELVPGRSRIQISFDTRTARDDSSVRPSREMAKG